MPRAAARKHVPTRASRVLALVLSAALCAWLGGCAASAAPARAAADAAGGFARIELPGAGAARLQALVRGARAAPLRYRVIVIPGSGCAGMGRFAGRYFAGLLHAQVLVLHKPGVQPQDATAPGDCPPAFVQADALSAWQAHALAAVRAWLRSDAGTAADLPTVLVGISEGAELLPALAPAVPRLAGLVLLSASGLDPRAAGRLQAQRSGALAQWQALAALQAGSAPDSAVAQGRSLRYWRDLWRWRVQQPLLDGPWPLLHVWGEADALVPPEAYARFARQARGRAAPYCARSLPGADHGLQAPGRDGVQQAWAWLEQWARQPEQGLCGPLLRVD